MAGSKTAPLVVQKKISSFFTSKSTSTTHKPPSAEPVLTSRSGNFPKRSLSLTESDDQLDDGPPQKRQKTPADPSEFDLAREPLDKTRKRSHPSPQARRNDNHEASNVPALRRHNTSAQSPLAERVSLQKPTENTALRQSKSERTSKYLFGASVTQEQIEEDDAETVLQKQKLHQRFVKKLGRPDSIADIKRRSGWIEDPTAEDQGVAEDDEGDEETRTPPKGRKGSVSKKTSGKLTPMEIQMLDIKRNHLDTLLVIEVGYKFRFFGEDARTAAKELSIVCIPGKFRYDEHPSEAHIDRFASASIPVHRLHVHVKRLVAAGHKVGVVRQLETAALKAAGDNRNAPFVRKLTNLYTKGTYIDEVEGLDGPTAGPSGGAPATGHLLCITETNATGWGTDEKVHVGIVAVQPGTGDIIYDDFEDGFMRSEIETRMLHISPCELLIVGDLSRATEKLVQHLAGSKTNVFGDKARVERVGKPKTMAAHSYSHISKFYADKLKSHDQAGDGQDGAQILDKVHKLSEHVSVCLSAMITHLIEYGLEHVFDLTKNFQAFSARSHMLLNGNTLTSLEIFRNQTDNSERGSLFWILDQTQTRFGQRLLRKWVGRPLVDKVRLQERIDAVEELNDSERSIGIDKLRHLLAKTKTDLEKSLIRIYYHKCTRPELLSVLQTLQRIATEYAAVREPSAAGFQSSYINDAIATLPTILEDVVAVLDKINPEAAKTDDKYTFLREEHETESMTEHRLGLITVEQDLDYHRKEAATKLRKPKVDYTTCAGIDYLIEVENTSIKSVPASWAKISGTKKLSRFHTPEVVKFLRHRDQHKEALAAACDDAFSTLLTDISANYQAFRNCIQSLATLDCLLSLADVANRPNYCKPTFTSDTRISILGGRHPMVEQLLLDTYVPNDIDLSPAGTRALLITGPNMGGKSSYVRQIALVCIMAQIGSYVPASTARLGMLDAVFTRMGAFDNMMKGESTFMVELSETSDILKQAGPRSLVILDELGRGTSTHDGVAIARAVLEYIVRNSRCLTLFITHYQSLANVANGLVEGELRNVHMRFTEDGAERGDGEKDGEDAKGGFADQDITFLYEVGEGVAHRSYGLNVARLANIPKSVIESAGIKSRELEEYTRRTQLASLQRTLSCVLQGQESLQMLVEGVEQL